ncbi:MerR family transcriptional regulator [Pradoshia eiseniae]|uniref:MerR family transcriptional regulator n=1 Tax=Pradoshia eiseniae TaxID=2064768 RepID=A0A2S7N4V2_9BACI|nr:MerR family transcriptional regulator [Pradoshia eiseniae]PQD97111.1 MerR family transcriptional regulator [Pradoshia eiseniae]
MNRWTTGQVAKERNISVRTLRYYDQISLLTPSYKDENGRRYYSEEDLFKLEKIIILKTLSLSLEDIQYVLDKISYKQILVSHHNHLQEQLTKLQANISNTVSLINMLDIDESLSWEQISYLVQRPQESSSKWIDYFEEDERQFLKEVMPSLEGGDRSTQKYVSLLRRIELCIKHRISPESEEGNRIASELMDLSNDTFKGDEGLMDKFWEIRRKPSEETGLYPISEEVLEFIERCISYQQSNNKSR